MDSRIYSEKTIASIKSHLEKNGSKFITYPKFVFLCGKAIDGQYENTNRGILQNYLQKQSKNIFIVLSELLWEEGFNSNIDLLTFEEFLAEISDVIVLFCESPGSYCELGAFAYANKLFSDKLAIIRGLSYCRKNDLKYSRYADDIYLSSDSYIDIPHISFLSTTLRDFGFQINEKKTYFFSAKYRWKVTGLIIGTDLSVTVGSERRKLIKKLVYDKLVHNEGHGDSILGHLAFLKDIEPHTYNNIIAKYSQYCEGDIIDALSK